MSCIGKKLRELDTPVLWTDLDIMEKNIAFLAAYMKSAGVNWRPHTKGIKIPAIAHKLVKAGAIGVTCAKLGEAEVMAAGGIGDILVANEIVGENKIRRLAHLQHHADVMVCVDDLENARSISRIAVETGVQVRVLVELNIGMERCGLQPGPHAVDFARQVADLPGLKFSGLMGWEGHLVRMENLEEKRTAIEKSVGLLVETARLCRESGLEIPIVSCGGSGTYTTSAHIAGVTEIEAGGASFGDLVCQITGAGVQFSLFVTATVISASVPGHAVLDVGRKAINMEYVMPRVRGQESAQLTRFSAEHAVMQYDPEKMQVKVGDVLDLIVGYGDLTVFLHDMLYGVRNGIVEAAWPVLGRGKLS